MPLVLIIDDDSFSRKIAARVLGDDYEIANAVDGKEGVAKAMALQPDIILLDVEMPNMNGYQACKALKQSKSTESIPVIFISSHTTPEEQLKGYEAGADDFILKPFEKKVLQAKVKLLCASRVRHEQLRLDMLEAQKTAMTAMMGSSELGMAMQFMERTLSIDNYDSLADAIFQVTNNLSLNCSLMFHADDAELFFSSLEKVRPLEHDVMVMLAEKGRIFDFGCRTQINYSRASLLIKNMPLEDSDRYGRIKDMVPFLLSASEAKIIAIQAKHDLDNQMSLLNETMETVKVNLHNQAEQLHKANESALSILNNLLNEYEKKIPYLGLEEDQEVYLIKHLDDAILEAKQEIESGEKSKQGFADILVLLQELIDHQDKLIAHQEISQPPQNGTANEVELF